jgi:hypothetical protein
MTARRTDRWSDRKMTVELVGSEDGSGTRIVNLPDFSTDDDVRWANTFFREPTTFTVGAPSVGTQPLRHPLLVPVDNLRWALRYRWWLIRRHFG